MKKNSTTTKLYSFEKSKQYNLKLLLFFTIFLLGINATKAQATISSTNLSFSTCSFPSTYNNLGDIIITEVSNGDVAAATSKTLVLNAPTNFEFKATTGSASFSGGKNITAMSTSVTTTQIIITYDCTGTNKKDVITISGIQVRGINTASTGSITRDTSSTGTITFAGSAVYPTLTSTLSPAPTTAAAGLDQNLATCTTTTTLAGNTPTVGTGTWTVVSGTATITTPTSATSGVTGLVAGTSAVLQWSITNGCTPSTDTVTITVPAGSCYCSIATTSSTYWISNVTTTGGFTNINNSTTYSTGGYGNYTSQIVSQIATGTVNFNVTTSSSTHGINIWIDYNADGDFNDAGEKVYASGTYVSSATGSFVIPGTVPAGNYRMRIVANYLETDPLACGTDTYTEAEDYTLQVSPPPTCYAPTVLASASSTTTGNANWTASTSGTTPVGYEYVISTSNTIPVGSGTATTSTTANFTSLTSNTTYYVFVRSNCGSGDFSSWSGSSFYTGFCSSSSSSSTYYISSFSTTGGTSNISNLTSGYSAGGYGNFTAKVVSQVASGSVAFNAVFYDGFYSYGFNIWVDWNDDLDFNDAGELVFASGAYVSSASGSITVPAAATVGNHRMRIKANYNSSNPNACGAITSGETEDYTFTVLAPLPCSGNPSALNVFLVSQTSTTVSWTAATPAPASGYQYYYSTSNTAPNAGTTPSGSVGAGVTSVTLTGLTSGTTYYFWVRSNCGGGLGQGIWIGPINFTQPTCAIGPGTGTTALGCPNNTAGGLGLNGAPAPAINCSTSSCVDLEAIYSPIKETTSYTVASIPYSPPYQFSCLRNPVSVNIDDKWSPVVNLPFNFCFYGNTYNKCLIGSNGVITFNTTTNTPGGTCDWSFSAINGDAANLPVAGHSSLVENSIFGVFHDINPANGGEIGWELITLNTGCRALVASWSNVPMYLNDTTNNYTGMMVLYENTNIIEVYIQKKRITTYLDGSDIWNEGNAVIGIQNATGTVATVPPGRNGLDANWTATNEAWRFTPNGANVPASVKWYEGAGTTGTVVGTGNTVSVCPSTTTTYTAEVTYTLCNGLVHKITAQTPVTVNIDKIWNGSTNTNWNTASNWTPSGVPLATHSVSIPNVTNDPIISGGVTAVACSVSVENGGVLTILPNNNITVTNAVKVVPGGQFIVQNTANLVQINNVSNSGNIEYNRTATGLHARDYIYWSTPVENFGVANVSPLTSLSRIYHWVPDVQNGGTLPKPAFGWGNWANVNETMIAGKGYIVRVPDSNPTFATKFTGKPQNGIITKSIVRGPYTGIDYSGTNNLITKYDDNWNLVGNPYPSAIDAIEFLTVNNTSIMGEVSLWTHTTPISMSASPYYQTFIYNYKSNDYVTYNSAGNNVGPTGGFNGKIGAGQAFFVKMIDGSAGSGTITFNNGMRTDASNNPYNNGQFYRTGDNSQSAATETEKHRIWLDLIDSDLNTSRVMFGYMNGATNGKDHMYDATTNYTESLKAFTTIENEEDVFVIQGKGLPFKSKDKIGYGIQVPKNATYTIAISDVDGLFKNASQKIYIEDLLSNVTHDLTTTPYSFTSDAGTFKNRFLVKFEDKTLSNDDTLYANSVIVFGKDQLTVKSELFNIKNITVYDILGKTLINAQEVNTKEHILLSLKNTNSALLVKVSLENGAVVTKKVIY